MGSLSAAPQHAQRIAHFIEAGAVAAELAEGSMDAPSFPLGVMVGAVADEPEEACNRSHILVGQLR